MMNSTTIITAIESYLNADNTTDVLSTEIEQLNALAEQFTAQLSTVHNLLHQAQEQAATPLGNDDSKARYDNLFVLYRMAHAIYRVTNNINYAGSSPKLENRIRSIVEQVKAYRQVFGFALPDDLYADEYGYFSFADDGPENPFQNEGIPF